MKRIFRAAAAALALLFTVPAFAVEVPREARVGRVIDGDTFDLESGERIRLIGVNSPENQPHKSNVDWFGPESSRYVKKILSGQKVRLEFDVEKKDKYGRTLAYVFLQDGRFLNLLLVKEGIARAKYYKPNGLHRNEFRLAEKEAKLARRGLWGEPPALAA